MRTKGVKGWVYGGRRPLMAERDAVVRARAVAQGWDRERPRLPRRLMGTNGEGFYLRSERSLNLKLKQVGCSLDRVTRERTHER